MCAGALLFAVCVLGRCCVLCVCLGVVVYTVCVLRRCCVLHVYWGVVCCMCAGALCTQCLLGTVYCLRTGRCCAEGKKVCVLVERKLRVNVCKSKVMRCSRCGNGGRMHVILNGEPLEEVDCFSTWGAVAYCMCVWALLCTACVLGRFFKE